MCVCVFLHRKSFKDLAWSAFGCLEENQYIHVGQGVAKGNLCIGGKEIQTYTIQDKTKRELRPGSLLFLLGNTLHAGSRFEGDKEALEKKVGESALARYSNYREKMGDLKIFFDIDGALKGQKTGCDRHQQLWCYETGNKYGVDAGFTTNKSVLSHVDITDENDACSDHNV